MYVFALASLPHRKFSLIVISTIASFYLLLLWMKANVYAYITIQNAMQTSVKPEASFGRHSEFFLLETEAERSSWSSVSSCLDPWGK